MTININGKNPLSQTGRISLPKVEAKENVVPAAQPKPVLDQANVAHAPAIKTLSAVAQAAKVAQIGNKVVDGARALHQNGYTYPANLTDQYRHVAGKIGCCADFVCDSNKQAGFDIGADMARKGYNPHYCHSMIKYYHENQTLLKPNAKAQVGDTVFFNWDGKDASQPSHVGVVTKVDDRGRPTEMIESNSFSQPSKVTAISWDPPDHHAECLVGYGRLKDATADNAAANLLPPLANQPGAPSASTSPRHESGNGGPVKDYGPVATQAAAPSHQSYQPSPSSLELLLGVLKALGIEPRES